MSRRHPPQDQHRHGERQVPQVVTIAPALARQGLNVVRGLTRPPTGETQPDPWAIAAGSTEAPLNWQRGQQVARRGAGTALLVGLALLGLGLLLPLILLLGVGVANGSAPAGWVLVLVLLLALVGLFWTGRRVLALWRTPPSQPDPATPSEENDLLTLLREYGPRVSEAARPAFQATVLATRDALRATTGQTTLTRESFDARQAARSDLPELLHAYHALPVSSSAEQAQRDQAFLEQLRLIEGRMQEVKVGQRQTRERQLQANGAYLRDKYRSGEEPE
ncbi:MAG: hypothetical protein Q4C89_00385 [Deinococcus sp.]|uniref:hypothetical protein n=1 Tax=Deinococcus sp. TaxID=47478 RepID=UPI0026DDA5BE|nr:hypothetical protein [Deinococcus sp.]MDO4244466.1 hypothetical protein [Deinococcus sp.]